MERYGRKTRGKEKGGEKEQEEIRGGVGEGGVTVLHQRCCGHPPSTPTYPVVLSSPPTRVATIILEYTNTSATACMRAYRVVAGGVVTAFFLALAGGEVAEASGLARVVERFRILWCIETCACASDTSVTHSMSIASTPQQGSYESMSMCVE